LNAEPIAVEHERTALIVEGVEHDLDIIVVSQRIAGQHVGADEAWRLVVTNESDKEVFPVVAQVGHSRFCCRPSVLGISLDEVADAQHLPGRLRAYRIRQEIVQARLTVEPRNGDVV
jgi:hypothetical protein